MSNGNLDIDTRRRPAPASRPRCCSSTAPPNSTGAGGQQRGHALARRPAGGVAAQRRGGPLPPAFTYDFATVDRRHPPGQHRLGRPEPRQVRRRRQPGPDRPLRRPLLRRRPGDLQPDWVDLDRVAIPQADEQQRLLANLIVQCSAHPHAALLVLPARREGRRRDDRRRPRQRRHQQRLRHAAGAGPRRVPRLAALDPPSSTVGGPREPRTSIPDNAPISPRWPTNWTVRLRDRHAPAVPGRRLVSGLHARLAGRDPDREAAIFAQKSRASPALTTTRTHCIAWSDWDSQPKADLAHGIRLNTDYYYFPAVWTHDRPGMFTGSGMPMRFAGRRRLVDRRLPGDDVLRPTTPRLQQERHRIIPTP